MGSTDRGERLKRAAQKARRVRKRLEERLERERLAAEPKPKIRWRVSVVSQHVFEVIADDYVDAERVGKEQGRHPPEGSFVSHSCRVLSQEGEPWAHGGDWYDLHDVSDVIYVKRATGHVFTENDIALLRSRLARLGFDVVEHWNGENCSSVSFRCTGRRGREEMSEQEKQVLLAPRSKRDAAS